MKNTLRIDHKSRAIVMDRLFAKNSCNVRFKEYNLLQRVRHDYPSYEVVVRHIKRNPNKETYRGLTYAYMERYIASHANAEVIMAEYRELRLISECHCKARRYPKIKKWFLKTYPEVELFGMEDADDASAADTHPKYEVVMAPLVKSNAADTEPDVA